MSTVRRATQAGTLTVLAAAEVDLPKDKIIDGKNMLPALQGQTNCIVFFWSSGGESGDWAIRSVDWKRVGVKDKMDFFDLSKVVSEKKDLAKKHPNQIARLN